jgi:PAS domain S-box-containing protein
MMQRQKFYHYLLKEKRRREFTEADLQQRLKQQEAVASFGESALSTKNLDDLFQQCVLLVKEILNVEFTKILELMPDGRFLRLRAGTGWFDGLIGHTAISAGANSPAGYTLLYEEPIIVSDLNQDPRFHNPRLLKDHHAVSGMSIAIPGRERPFGVMGVYTTTKRAFNQHDARFLKSIANILASFIERSRVEIELRHSHNELSIILNGVAEAVTVLKPGGELLYANQAAAQMLGFETPEQLFDNPYHNTINRYEILDEKGCLVSPDTLPSHVALLGKKMPPQKVRFRVLETREERWSIVDSTPIYDAAGHVIMAVNIFRDITDIVREEQMQQLLAEAGRLLFSSLDYKTTLSNLTDLAVEMIADWCVVHIIAEDGQINQLGVSHKDPLKRELAQQLQQKYPPSWEESSSLVGALRTGEIEYFPEITDEILAASARDTEHLEILRTLGLNSAMIVPLIARDQILGAISLIWAESNRRYTDIEVEIVQELARRAAIAIENAQIYQQAQALNSELELRVSQRTEQLQHANRLLQDEILEHVHTYQALQTSEVLLNSMFESAPDATVLVNSQGKIIRVNRQAEMLFGYDRDEVVGKSILILIPERYNQAHKKQLTNFFKRSITRTMGIDRELFAVNKDGIEFPVDIMLSPLNTGHEIQVISSIRDITNQKNLQAELAETHQRLLESMEAERISLARELHDGPMQDLYSISWKYETLKSVLPPGEAVQIIEDTQQTLQIVVDTLRDISGELRPPALDHLGLEKAILSHIGKISETHPHLKIEANLWDSGKNLSDRTKITIYRVYQNALNNIIRHSQAKQVIVNFQIDGDMAYLEISDDGCGFILPKRWVELARGGHFGLVGMIERVHAIGGKMEVISSPGEGTTIKVTAPVRTDRMDSEMSAATLGEESLGV